MDNQDNSLKKRWLKTTLIVLASAFGISLLFFEGQTLDMIRGNSYYTSSFSILTKELFWPFRFIIPCTIFIVFIGQIVFWLSEAFNHHKSTEKKSKMGYILIPIISIAISIVLAWYYFINNFNWEF